MEGTGVGLPRGGRRMWEEAPGEQRNGGSGQPLMLCLP